MNNKYKMLLIGTSAGGLNALSIILPKFPANLPVAVVVINHRMETPDSYLTELLQNICALKVQDAEHLALIEAGSIYIAPPGYHLLIADDYCFNLSADPRVNASRPSIDVGFETAAEVYGENLIGVILTGANSDGALGLKAIKTRHGYTIVQDPKNAETNMMPLAAISTTNPDFVGTLSQIATQICYLCGVEERNV